MSALDELLDQHAIITKRYCHCGWQGDRYEIHLTDVLLRAMADDETCHPASALVLRVSAQEALDHVERYGCPCGARAESITTTHPHVMGCPVGLLRNLLEATS